MRRTDIRLTRQLGLALVAALLLALVFVGVVSARPAEPLAPDVPNVGHCFYGTVTTDRGIPLPGSLVTARAVSGYWKGTLTALADGQGRYGWDGKFCIPGYDSSTGNGAKQGDLIGFFVNGAPAYLFDVATGKTSSAYPFAYFGNSQLNLLVPLQETITATAGENGTITPEGTVKVDYGMNQTFTFTPAPGYMILDVLVDGVSNPAAVAAGSYTFTNVTRSHTIHVTFVRADYLITPSAGAGCTITPGTAQTVPYQGSITFTIAANAGYQLLDVEVDDASQGAVASYTFTNVAADHTISATCQKLAYKYYLPFISKF